MKAMILDDSKTDSYLASQVASSFFDDVQVFGTPYEFRVALASNPLPHICFLDIHIGDLHSGIGELDLIRSAATEVSNIPVIIVTASTDPALHKFAIECGANAVIVKPITKDKMAPWVQLLVPEYESEGQ
jgi:CheY-like chemotaxis protein